MEDDTVEGLEDTGACNDMPEDKECQNVSI